MSITSSIAFLYYFAMQYNIKFKTFNTHVSTN